MHAAHSASAQAVTQENGACFRVGGFKVVNDILDCTTQFFRDVVQLGFQKDGFGKLNTLSSQEFQFRAKDFTGY